MAPSARQRRLAPLTPLVIVTAAALVFTVLLVLIRLRWRPLESADHGAAAGLNNLISGDHTAVTVVRDFTQVGGAVVVSAVVAAAVLLLALRRRWRLAVYLVATGVGALVLDPVVKALVGRLRPVVAHPVAHAPGDSFPSGHSLGSLACYGALYLVFAPAVRGRWRTGFGIGVAVLVALVGISRTLLGVHFVSDVLGGWALGIAWLGLTSVAFELARHAAGRPVSHPVAEGLEPEARSDLRPAQPDPAAAGASPSRGAAAAGIAVAWVLILGVIVGIGKLIMNSGGTNLLGDTTVPRWLAAHRTPGLTGWSLVFTTLGGTIAVAAVVAVACLVFVAVTRRWRPAVYLVTLILGELALFLAAAAVVKRPRPAVSHLDHHLPTSAYPSGHVAATCCVYAGLAVLVVGHTRGWWRWLSLVPAVAFPLLVALSRMYRGEHHPTDVLASFLFAALWVPVVTFFVRPTVAGKDRTTPGGPRSGHGLDDAPARSAA